MITQIHQSLHSLKNEGADVVSASPEIIQCLQEMANGINQVKNAVMGQVGVGAKQQPPKVNPMQMQQKPMQKQHSAVDVISPPLSNPNQLGRQQKSPNQGGVPHHPSSALGGQRMARNKDDDFIRP